MRTTVIRIFLGPALLLAAAAAWPLAGASADASTITVGSPLTASNGNALCGSCTLADAALAEPSAYVASPVSGVIVRWQVGASNGAARSTSEC